MTFKHVEEQIALLHDRHRKCLKCYMNDICNYCQERIAAADTMQALLDVARAADTVQGNANGENWRKLRRAIHFAKLQEQDDD